VGQRESGIVSLSEGGSREDRRSYVRLLDADPDLPCSLRPHELELATQHAVAAVRTLGEGGWLATAPIRGARATTMLFVLEGLLLHEVSVGDRKSAELIGAGDVIHPWSVDPTSAFPEGRWTVLRRARVAVLDDRFLYRTARWPALGVELASRAGRRGQTLAAQTLASQARCVDERILLVFSLLASHWGRVSPNGIVLSVPLSHALIGRLVGARRPLVSSALGELRRQGALAPLGHDGWLLDEASNATRAGTFRVRPETSGSPAEAVVAAGGAG